MASSDDLRDMFKRGIFCGMLLMLGAQSIYWFTASWHPDASTFRVIGVAAQGIVTFGIAALVYVRVRTSFNGRSQALQ